jgi:uncharacterized oxidoreductase
MALTWAFVYIQFIFYQTMNITNNTILITGGATGIGLALAEAFLNEGNDVIICGRRESALLAAQARFPKLHIRVADLTQSDGRKEFAQSLAQQFPNLNVLVNNAGIQRQFFLTKPDVAGTFETENEIETNLTAPVHLTMLLLPHLRGQSSAAIINVTSGLGFIPVAVMPVYCATKAALHSFSISLRFQLQQTGVKVFEVIPPLVATDLDKGAREQRGQNTQGAIQPQEVATATLQGMKKDIYEIAVGRANILRFASRLAPARFLKILNRIAKA